MRCHFVKTMECKEPSGCKGYCEGCLVPRSFGWFITQDKPGHFKWEQRFILDRDRREQLNHIEHEEAKLKNMRYKLLEIPSRDEYLTSELNKCQE